MVIAATRRLRAALGFLQLPPRAPELQLLHRWIIIVIALLVLRRHPHGIAVLAVDPRERGELGNETVWWGLCALLVTGAGSTWRPAVRAAAIPDFSFHDLRHTFASRPAMTPGVDLYTIQKAGGWKTPIMVQRYAHLSPDHIRAAVE